MLRNQIQLDDCRLACYVCIRVLWSLHPLAADVLLLSRSGGFDLRQEPVAASLGIFFEVVTVDSCNGHRGVVPAAAAE